MALPTPQSPFELTLIQVILDAFELDEKHAGSVVPDDVEDHLPYFCITRLGGPRSTLTDYPVTDVDVYDETPGKARANADIVDELFSGPDRVRAAVVDGVRRVIDRCECNKQPSRMPWDGDEARYGSVYAWTLRRQ